MLSAIMTAEAPSPIDLKSLSVQDLGAQALRELSVFGDEIKSGKSTVERALANVAVINKLRELPAVQAYLETRGIHVLIIASHSFMGWSRLDVSSRGLEIRWPDRSKNSGSSFFSRPFSVTREAVDYYEHDPLYDKKAIVRKLARLKPEQIVKKFEKAV